MARINDWLGEGIDQDAEGEYSERSPNYASEVTNRSLVTIARLADKPRLLGNVRRNLALTLYRLEVNGEVETVQSRRQDQTGIQDVWKYLMHFRELALVDGDRRFAAVAEQIIDRVSANPESFATSGYSVGEFLAEALAYPDLTALLPQPVEPVTTYQSSSGARNWCGSAGKHHRQHLRRHRLAQPPGGLRRATHHHSRDRLGAVHQSLILQTSQRRGDPGFGADVTPVLQHRALPQ